MNETVTRFHYIKPVKLSMRYCSKRDSWKHVKSAEQIVNLTRSPLKLSTGKLARFCNGSCTAQLGGTAVMVASVSETKLSTMPFMPLTVDYRQKAAAAGRIPTNYFRKELSPTEKEILTSRLIDRSVRPLFPKNYKYQTQLSCNLLAVDGINDPDVISINAASASLAVSDIPWDGPIGAVRVGMIDGEIVVQPTRKEISQSTANIIIAATSHNQVIMLDAFANNMMQQDLMKAIKVGVRETQVIIKGIENLQKQIGKPKRIIEESSPLVEEIKESARLIAEVEIKDVLTSHFHDKISRGIALDHIRTKTIEMLKENFKDTDLNLLSEILYMLIRDIFRSLIFETNVRCDGRGLTDLRDINCATDLHSPLHGSAIFQRGQTQVFCTVAFDSLDSSFISDPISVITGGIKEKNFMLHYEFPQYATNEIGKSNIFGRRELGHGALAEKSLRPVIPSNFPFTIRLTSEVLESNGSSSMASVCGGSLALMDAGVPISTAVAGVAIGLISKPDSEKFYEFEDYKLLTDILGIEDFLGDMDFKFAGTKKGITAIQMDLKISGLPVHVLMEAIKQATDAKNKILNIMNSVIAKPREKEKENWPVSEDVEIPAHQRSKFFGFGGCNVKKLTAETGVRVTTIDDGNISLFAPNKDAMAEAKEMIKSLLAEENMPELEFRKIYTADIVEIKDSGVMVTLYPNMKPALLHNSQLDQRKIHHPSALGLEVGQQIMVQYFGRDPASGNMRLSRKVLQSVPTYGVQNYFSNSKESTGESKSEA